MRIVLTGGGTGGHVMPFAPIIEALRSYYFKNKEQLPAFVEPKELSIYFVGISDQKVKDFFHKYDVPVTHVPSGKLRRYFSLLNFIDLFFKLPIGILLALWQMWRLMPDVVLSKGGYGSLPTVLAAAFYRIPILLHESDAVPGMANNIAMKFATAITTGLTESDSLPEKWQYKTFVTGTPVRSGLTEIDPVKAKESFNISPDEFVLLVIGGSQGAKQLNEIILQVLPNLIMDVTVIHLTGDDHFTAISTVAKELLASSSHKERYKPFPYLTDNMSEALSAADAVVSRAGATTLAELTHLKKPVLLIPLDTSASDHQRHNARYMEKLGAALVLDPTNLGTNLFAKNIRKLIDNQEVRDRLKTNMTKIDRPEAAHSIAGLSFRLATGYAPVKGGKDESK